MRLIGLASLAVFGTLATRGYTAPPPEHKPEEEVHVAKPPAPEHEPEVALVQPVAILMDNGDVVPLPVGGAVPVGIPGEDGAAELEAAAAGYGDGFGEYPGMYYGAYPPPPAPGAFAYDQYEQEMIDGGRGRNLTQKGYGYGAGYYGGIAPMGPLRPPLINKPVINTPIINKPVINKGYFMKRPYVQATYEVADRPIIEQPIYRPPMTRPVARPAVQPLYDSRIYYGDNRAYYSQLPAHISCPTGMKCTAKSYYTPAARPVYPAMAIPGRKAPKYLKRSAYGAQKYRY